MQKAKPGTLDDVIRIVEVLVRVTPKLQTGEALAMERKDAESRLQERKWSWIFLGYFLAA